MGFSVPLFVFYCISPIFPFYSLVFSSVLLYSLAFPRILLYMYPHVFSSTQNGIKICITTATNRWECRIFSRPGSVEIFRIQNMDGTLIPTADVTKIKQNVISGPSYFKQNCSIFRFAIQTFLRGWVEKKNMWKEKPFFFFYSPVFSRVPQLYSVVLSCIPLYSIVFSFIPLYFPVFSCIPLYSLVFPCIILCSPVFSYVPLYSLVFPFIIWLCLTRTGNYQIHEFDWLDKYFIYLLLLKNGSLDNAIEEFSLASGKFSLLSPSLRQQLVLVLCLHRVTQTLFLTNQRAHFFRAVF